MKKITFLLVACSMLLFITSCNKSDPGEVAQHFFQALYSKNFPEAKKYATVSSGQMIDMIATFNKSTKDSSKAVINIVVDQVKIDGNTATARVTTTNNNNSLIASLVKENNEWKVAFDKNSIMHMGQEPATNKSSEDTIPVKP
ncbi:MAG: nuclear transport factor 2 family protein [Chitinophagaceae bacterium]